MLLERATFTVLTNNRTYANPKCVTLKFTYRRTSYIFEAIIPCAVLCCQSHTQHTQKL